MSKIEVRNPFSYDADGVSNLTGVKCVDESLAVQSDRDDADINVIMAKCFRTGVLPLSAKLPRKGDFTGAKSLQDTLDLIREGEELFMELPAKVRREFDFNSAAFLDFCSNPSNSDRMRELGIIEPIVAIVEAEPQKVVIVDGKVPAKPA